MALLTGKMQTRVLILCTGNSCRSQMAEGYLRHFGKGKLDCYSAGIEAHGLNPLAVRVMQEDGVDIRMHSSNKVEEYAGLSFDYVLTVCDQAAEHCPVFPGALQHLHVGFPDPAKAVGTEAEVLASFREVRAQIKGFCEEWAIRLAGGRTQ